MESEWDDTITGYLFCVFACPSSNTDAGCISPCDSPHGGGRTDQHHSVYLRHRGDAQYLARLLEPLYTSEGIGISTSEDEIIPCHKLPAVAGAIRSALAQIEGQPDTWSVQIGYRYKPFSQELGEPIYVVASRQCLLNFLHGVLAEIGFAQGHGYDLSWGGGE